MLLWFVAGFIMVVLFFVMQSKKKEALAPAKAQVVKTDSTYKAESNTNYDEVFSEYYTDNTKLSQCMADCNSNPDCVRLVSTRMDDDVNSGCFFKDERKGSPRSYNGRFAFTKTGKPIPTETVYSEVPNMNYSGGDIVKLQSGRDNCKKECDKMDECEVYITQNNGNTCWIKTKDAKKNPIGDSNWTSYIKAPFGMCDSPNEKVPKADAVGSNCNMEFSQQLPATGIDGPNIAQTSNTRDWESCKQQCKANPECKGFVADERSANCFFKGQSEPTSYIEWGSSFLKAPFGFCPDGVSRKKDFKGTTCPDYTPLKQGWAFEGDNIREYNTNNETECKGYCAAHPQCKGYMMGYSKCYTKTTLSHTRRADEYSMALKAPFGLCPDGITPKDNEKGTICSATFDSKPGLNYGENDIVGGLGWMRLEDCQYTCKTTPNCKGYSYNASGNGTCYLKNRMANESGNPSIESGIMQNFGMCPDGVTPKTDASGTKCFGQCDNDTSIWKLDASGSGCWGVCDNNDKLYRTDEYGTNCFGKCTFGDKSQWKIDASGTNCWGACEVGDTSLWKMDNTGTGCFGVCDNDDTLYKMDASGQKGCFGKCENNSKLYKYDASGLGCFGKCENNTTLWKMDPAGLGCWDTCDNDETIYRMDASGTNCFGKCEFGNKTAWKIDDAGTNCYGKCPLSVGGYKKNANDTCFGECPEEIGGYKKNSKDTCYGTCPNGKLGYKESPEDTCTPNTNSDFVDYSKYEDPLIEEEDLEDEVIKETTSAQSSTNPLDKFVRRFFVRQEYT